MSEEESEEKWLLKFDSEGARLFAASYTSVVAVDLWRAASLLLVSLTPEAPQENVFGQSIFGDDFFFFCTPVVYVFAHSKTSPDCQGTSDSAQTL